MFGTRFFAAVSAALLASTAVSAAPNTHARRLTPNQLDVYTPAVTAPTTGTIWNTGETQLVTWDTSKLSDQGKQAAGFLLLGYNDPNNTDSGEHLDIQHPLATGFKLGDGQTNVTVPSVQTRDTYIVVLIGDSGDASKEFTINGTPAVTSAASIATSA